MSRNLYNASEYVVSGVPYVLTITTPVSGSAMLEVVLPDVPKFVTVYNKISDKEASNKIIFGFTSDCNDSGTYIELDNREGYEFSVKNRTLYFSSYGPTESSASIVAGLTTIMRG